ncbi:protein scarlet [Anoplophora glabripennis]|uniref:protein scarlet n=1 Tax=Anoplophora glabripennis TaxID=217634 RepID=UPI0008739712|nr:protein scarlet [Anoplophora glabripennis]
MIPPFIIQWENLSVTVTEKRCSLFRTVKKKKILSNVSGFATSNSLIAVMGPSGAGKTTFLGAISGKLKGKEGTLRINNRTVTDKDMCNISSYIRQEDVFTESLTVYEHMKFMAALKLHKTGEERIGIIKKLLIELCLDGNSRTIIGVLSGGQRRRLSLATELISDPYILFCDEPTTGLDSFSAMSVVKILEATAMTGKLVLVTLHQPSSQIFDLFNNIILLANGKLVFQGSKREAQSFFERANLVCPDSYNPADFYIKCVTVDSGNEEDRKTDWLSDLFHNNSEQIITDRYNPNEFTKQKMNKRSFFVQLRWLVWRVFIDFKRSIHVYRTSYILLMITALIIGVSFSNVTLENKSNVQNVQGVLILIVSELIFTHMYYVIYVFPEEIVIFVKEKSLYSSLPYYLSKVVSLMPISFINAISFLAVYLALLQFLQNFNLFLNMSIVLFLTSLCGISLGLCLSALFPTVEYIHLFIVPFEIVVMIVSGIWIKVDTLPGVFRAVKYFSPFYYGFQSVSTLCWENAEFLANCTTGDVLPCYSSSEEVLRRYGLYEEYDVVTYNNLYLSFLTLLYCSVGYFGILRKRAIESY